MRILLATTFAAAALSAQTAPTFEVATIHPAPEITTASQKLDISAKMGVKVDAGHVDIVFQTLRDMIRYAYRVKDYQITGPAWLGGDRWVVAAKIPEGVSKDRVPEMVQALLADRFKLVVHRESKERGVLGLVVAKDGPKMERAADGQELQPLQSKLGEEGMLHMTSRAMPMSRLVDSLTQFADRPVINMTELSGNYQVTLDVPMAEMKKSAELRASGGGGDPGSSFVFDIVRKLGLRLDSRKAPIEHIVVDSAERKPTEN